MDAIVTKNLTKQYKDITAVDSLNLSIKEGELYSLLGVNGAGKSTTIKMLSCLVKPTNGDAYVLGNSIITDANKVKEYISVSPQETAIAPNLSVRENLELIASIYKFSKAKTNALIDELTSDFELKNFIDKKASKLSGGYQRRLSIAMALISEPKILFLDEPTLGLDVLARQELWDKIRKLKSKMTIILTTHYMEEAEELSDNIGIMKDGKLIASGTAQELMEQTGKDKFEDAFVSIVRGM